MTAPLYDVKNKFSEYVSLAQNGQVIEVQKYGKPAVVILDAEEYYKSKSQKSNTLGSISDWRQKWEKVLAEEGDAGMDVFWDSLSKGRKTRSTRQNPFLEI